MKRLLLVLDNVGSIYSTPKNVDDSLFSIKELHKKYFKTFKHIGIKELPNNILMLYGNDSNVNPWEYNGFATEIINEDINSSIILFVSKYEICEPKKYSTNKIEDYSFENFSNDVMNIINETQKNVTSEHTANNSDASEVPINHINMWIHNNNILNIKEDEVNTFTETYLENKFKSFEKTKSGEIILVKNGLIGIVENWNNNGYANLFFTGLYKNTKSS